MQCRIVALTVFVRYHAVVWSVCSVPFDAMPHRSGDALLLVNLGLSFNSTAIDDVPRSCRIRFM